MKTHEQIFLEWCEKHKIKWRRKRVGHKCYELNFDHKAVLIVQGHTFKLNRMQDCDSIKVLFDENGKWVGGTNIIWNTNLPWQRTGG